VFRIEVERFVCKMLELNFVLLQVLAYFSLSPSGIRFSGVQLKQMNFSSE